MAQHQQIEKAIAIIQEHSKPSEDELIPEDQTFSVVFNLWDKLEYASPYPISIELPHPLDEDSTLTVRVITKDPHDEWKAKFKEAVPAFPIKSYAISRFKNLFQTASECRQILSETRLFLADSRVSHILDSALQQEFYKKKRVPVLVDLTGDDVIAPIEHELKCAHVMLPKGKTFAGTIGRISWSPSDLADNAEAIISAVFAKIGQEKVATIAIRTPSSLVLPVYSADISDILTAK